eukprot:scaffold6634_cov158-Amphora_coffeaeformis.AAC.18
MSPVDATTTTTTTSTQNQTVNMPSSNCGSSIVLSSRQEKTLCALIDAFLPPLPEPQKCDTAQQHQDSARGFGRSKQAAAETQYWTHRLSSDPEFLTYVKSRLNRKQRQSLSMLSNVGGTCWATGRLDVYTLADWPVPKLATLVQDALQSRRMGLSGRVRLWQSWKRFLCGSAFMYVTRNSITNSHGTQGIAETKNPYAWEALEYPGPRRFVDRTRDAHAVTEGLETLQKLNMSDNLTDLSPSSDECDVIVVGSGAGGAMAARVLAQAGWDVLVVEQGLAPRWPDRLLEMDGSYARPLPGKTDILLWTGGIIPNLGGATRFSMGICQELPMNVRQEWVDSFGLDDFGNQNDSAFEESLRFVLDEMQGFVTENYSPTKEKESESSLHSIFRSACPYLGLKPRVADSCVVSPTTTGLASLGKARGMMLPKATGIEYITFKTGERKSIRARKCVIVAAGALETPCLLRRSGLTKSRHIGRHLHLHPTSTVFGFLSHPGSRYLEDSRISIVCEQGEKGNGMMMHALTPHPGLMAMLLPWSSPQKFKERMLHLRYMLPIICMQRDTTEGCVTERRDGSMVVDYKLNKVDRSRILETVRAAVLVEAAAGATEVVSGSFRDQGAILESSTALRGYLQSVDKIGIHGWDNNLLSMHQMGSARMAATPNIGAVDPNGEAWECNGLFVMDCSIFPTAIGVHPIITIMVMARMLSLRLSERLQIEEKILSGVVPAPHHKAGSVSRKRQQHALQLRIKAFLHFFVRVVLVALLLVPAFLLWSSDLGSFLA